MRQMRHAVHLNFDGNRDLLFHLFRRSARPLRNDLDVIIRHVGIGFDEKAMK